MTDKLTKFCSQEILKRILPDNGFPLREKGRYRPDSTAWAILALASIDEYKEIIKSARSRLALSQEEGGRVSIEKPFAASSWPTALAVLAWRDSPEFETEMNRAVEFLINVYGDTSPRSEVVAHDTTLKGWPWIEGTHSWIEPTALAILALKASGYHRHERLTEAIQLIKDRQLKKGGWNYGNKNVFGQELLPTPYDTGISLTALRDFIDKTEIGHSLKYLRHRIVGIRTPLSLSWAIIGLKTWEEELPNADKWLMDSWYLQKRLGKYDTSLLSILLIANLVLSGATNIF